MPIFLEKVVLAVLVAIMTTLLFVNPWKFDWWQRGSLLVAAFAVAFFISYTLYRHNESIRTGQTAPISAPSPTQATGNATTSGSKSPAVTGNDNNITYGRTSNSHKKKPKAQE
ncbi:MAG TPA: hypothetical protein VGR93_01500 [Candidatus Acidoferrales bacterium]|nr:hypothetical protein [Candidatus Acidoferrales bacterium]